MSGAADVIYREFDLSQIAVANGTLAAAIVTASKRGAPFAPILSASPGQWTNTFGTPNPQISFASYCALGYLEKGNQLWTVRAVGAGATYGATVFQKKAADTAPVLFNLTDLDPLNFDFTRTINGSTVPGENLGIFYPVGPGGYSSSLQIEITSANLNPVGAITTGVLSTGGLLTPASYDYSITAMNSLGESQATAITSVVVSTGSANCVQLSWAPVLGATGYKVYGRTKAGAIVTALATVTSPTYTDTGADVPQVGTQQPTVTTIATTDEFTVNFYDTTISASKPQETYTVTLTEKLDGFGRQMRIDDMINTNSTLWRFSNNSSMAAVLPTIKSIAKTSLLAGTSGAAVTDSDIIKGWNLFSSTEKVKVRVLINGGYSTPAVQRQMVTIAESRQDCIAFLDMPSAKQRAQDAADYRNSVLNIISSNRAAIFAQDLLVMDTTNNRQLYVPPSGHMAGLAAYTAYVAAPWYPMAGLNRGQLNVLGVRYLYENGERQLLKAANINYVRDFGADGLALFEQVTMQGKQSALSWISIRFLMDEIQLTAKRFLLYQDHELNDDFMGRIIVGGLTDFLQTVVDARGLQRFLVVSDSRNNPPAIVGAGQRKVDVFLAPTLPAEQIIMNGVLTKQDAVFTSLIGQF